MMIENCLIRDMRPEDAAEVAAIEARSITPPWSRQGFLDALEQDTLMLVAEAEGKICGYVVMYVSFEEGEITNVAVAPEDRGTGIARKLMAETKKRALERKVERIVLEVRVSNLAANRLYEKCGFTELGIRRNFYEQPKEDARIMEWKLC